VAKYQELIVWQKSMLLVEEVYKIARQLPKYELFALGDQLRRAAVSVPSNIAEGQNRGSNKEVVQFCGIALGSLAETETQLVIVERLYKIDTSEAQGLTREINRMLIALIKSLRTKIKRN
jgi:four helix bundle protein